MAEKKKANSTPQKKVKIGRAPSLNERITDFSTGGYTNIKFVPKKNTNKK